jgi:tight adherence protein B
MTFTFREFWYALALTAVLVAFILLATGVYQLILEPVRKRKKATQRVNDAENFLMRVQTLKDRADRQKGWGQGLMTSILGLNRMTRLQQLMLQADVYRSPWSFWGPILLVDVAVSVIAYLVIESFVMAFLFALIVMVLPYCFLKVRKGAKSRRFENQMPDAMELLARSLRAGHTLPSALELLGEEMEPPVGTEMRIAYEEQKFGISVADSLLNMLERVDSMDLRYFVSAVLIQTETGGNLAELMENIAHVVRSRLNFKAKVRGLSATGRFSAIIMIVTPIAAFFGLMIMAPTYEKVLIQSSLGIKALLIGGGLASLGAYMLRRMIQSLDT